METKEKTEHNLLDTYLTYHNLTILSGSGYDCVPLMPYMLMDAMNLVYEEYVDKLKLNHNLKRLRTQWHNAYRCFNKDLFRCFDTNQQIDIVDKMDEFKDSIHNDVELFRVSVMNHFMNVDADTRLTMSAILACNHLAQSAQILWKWVRRSNRGNKLSNPHIAIVENVSLRLFDEYAKLSKINTQTPVDLSNIETISNASHNLCKAIADFSRTWSESNMYGRAQEV